MEANFWKNKDFRENEENGNSGQNWNAKTALWAGILLIPAASVALTIDLPIARWVQPEKIPNESPHQAGAPSVPPKDSPRFKIPSDVKRLLSWSEGFGHGLGVLLLGLVIYQLDPVRRRGLARAWCMALASGLIADGAKLLVGRTRPRAFDLQQPILESFTGFLPGLAVGSAGQSFPSAHVATAVGWALGLGWMYPRGRWIFVGLACLVLLQRIEAMAHFLSDTLAGAAVGCLVSSLFLPGGWLGGPFERWEAPGGTSPPTHPTARQQKEPTLL